MIFKHFNLVKRSSVLRNVLSGRVGYHPTWKMVLGLFPKKTKLKQWIIGTRTRQYLTEYNQRSDELSGGPNTMYIYRTCAMPRIRNYSCI